MKTVSLDQAYGNFGIPQKKYSLKSELFCRKQSKLGKLIFEATTRTDISQPLVVAWPDRDVEQPLINSSRPLKRTYAVAGQFVEDHSIGTNTDGHCQIWRTPLLFRRRQNGKNLI
jgi:hypothetical protein